MYLVRNFIFFLLDEHFTHQFTTESILLKVRLAFIGFFFFFIIETLNGSMKRPITAVGAVWARLLQVVKTDTEKQGEATEKDQEGQTGRST